MTEYTNIDNSARVCFIPPWAVLVLHVTHPTWDSLVLSAPIKKFTRKSCVVPLSSRWYTLDLCGGFRWVLPSTGTTQSIDSGAGRFRLGKPHGPRFTAGSTLIISTAYPDIVHNPPKDKRESSGVRWCSVYTLQPPRYRDLHQPGLGGKDSEGYHLGQIVAYSLTPVAQGPRPSFLRSDLWVWLRAYGSKG